MKKLQTADLRLEPCLEKAPEMGPRDWLDISIIMTAFCLGSGLLLANTLQVGGLLPALLMLGWAALAVAGLHPKLRAWSLVGCLALSLLLGLAAWMPVRSALTAVANDFLLWLSGTRRHIYFTYTGASSDDLYWLLLAVGPAMAGLWAHCAAARRRWNLLGLLLPALACAVGWLDFDVGMAMLLLGTVWQLVRCTRDETVVGLIGQALCIAGVCALGVLLALSVGAEGLHVRQSWEQELHSLRYDEESNSMPEGQLQDLPAWMPTNTAALEITMEQPQKLYLRGFVGEVYTDSAWCPLPDSVMAGQADLFYWLHQNDFYGQGILAQAYHAVGQGETKSITVKNISACAERLHLPYAAQVQGLADDRMIGDTQILARGDSYTTDYYVGSIPAWFSLQNTAAEHELGSYGICEQAYGEFVRENYLALPAQLRSLLAQLLDDPGSGKSLSQCKDEILRCLEETMTYQPYIPTENGKVDFASYTLQSSQMGYSVHYATLATLMLRYYGIPARYCEGYFLSAEQASRYSGDQTIVLDETYAHAWTEYYLDGVGWLPFEVTPGYVDKEELQGEGLGGEGSRTDTSPQHLPDLPQPQSEEPEGQLPSLDILLYLLMGLLLLLVLATLVLLLRRRLRLRRCLRAMAEADDRTAIAGWFAYGCWLLHWAGLCSQTAPDYDAVRRLQLEALYSDHVMTAQQRQQAERFADAALKRCKSQWNWLYRLYYRWIKCLY